MPTSILKDTYFHVLYYYYGILFSNNNSILCSDQTQHREKSNKNVKTRSKLFLLFFSLHTLFIPNQNGSIEKVKGIRIIPYFSRSSTSYFSGSSDSVILKFLLYLIERNITRHFGFDGRRFECNYLSVLCFFL